MRIHLSCMVQLAVGLLLLCQCAGCDSKRYLVPTPNVYTLPDWNPFAEVPTSLQGDTVSVLYVTDRAPKEDADDQTAYGFRRSRSAAFGEAVVGFGRGLSWEELVEASRVSSRTRQIEVKLLAVQEHARFGKSPPSIIISDEELKSGSTSIDPVQVAAESEFRQELATRLSQTPCKEVFIYVHGFNNTFEDAVLTTGELWHFLGREGVPICYTWPAGVGGLQAYEYTLESTEFTVYHLKQTLRLIASCPEVEKVHILAHSRGTAVTTAAVRELHLEIRGSDDTQKLLKLGTVILAAADMDIDVVIARNATERIARAVKYSALYITNEDNALGFSSWLFGGQRLGGIDLTLFDSNEVEALQHSTHLQIIDARVKELGSFGHSYFHANPAVSSDIMLLLRYHLLPGAEHGRPLEVSDLGLWIIHDEYPGKDWSPPVSVKGE